MKPYNMDRVDARFQLEIGEQWITCSHRQKSWEDDLGRRPGKTYRGRMKMSDGVYNMVSKAEIWNTIASLPITKAQDNGANDNVSVIMVNAVLAACSLVRAQSDLQQNPVR